ncbi:MAG: hypothetical protein GC184_05455 [Rhizobiales bacterium]|nr:hypothetical protein [Hyphomicrobiales bacterium]
MTETALTSWILTNGMAGFETQALGICEALGLTPQIKRVKPGKPWSLLAPWGPAAPDPAIQAPWPDVLIASGRQSIPYARMIARKSAGRTFVVILQDPKINPAKFDFVWAPKHDQLSGENVMTTLVSPHRLTQEKLAAEATRIAPEIAHLPHPRVAVLLGGTNKVYEFSEEAATRVAAQLAGLIDHFGAGLMVTPSRRTGEKQTAIIAEKLAGKSAVIWDGTDPNPYFAYLGSADAIVVTCDSVNMVGEATFTGKPVYVIELEGGSSKFRRFLSAIYKNGAARPFVGQLESWRYTPLDATQEIAKRVRESLSQHRARLKKG